MPFCKKPIKEQKKVEEYIPKDVDDGDFLELLKSKVSMADVLNKFGVDTTRNPTSCPMHGSKGGKCLGFQRETAHCFHCEGSWNIFSLVKDYNKCDFKDALEFLADLGGCRGELEESRKNYIKKQMAVEKSAINELKYEYVLLISGKNKDFPKATEILTEYILKNYNIYTTKEDQKNEVWMYDNGIYVPNGRSRIKEILREILEEHFSTFSFNAVMAKIEPDTYIDTDKFFDIKYDNEVIVENGILNIKTLELKPYDPKKVFFHKMPVEFDIEKKCPKIDKFLSDVLTHEEDVNVFYELAGFSLIKEYKFEKAFMLVGDGRNGKGKTIELLKRLVGVDSCCSIPLCSLHPESFAISELFGKNLNLAGDIGNQDLKDTSSFKSLTGRDLVTGKRKFLNNIHFENYAKLVFACNTLPMVYDMSKGFWDRWILLEFPYTFVSNGEYNESEDKSMLKIRDPDIINKITSKEEMSGLLNKALMGLAKLTSEKRFSSAKGSDQVKSTWIKKSNSFIAFCYDCVEEDSEANVSKKVLRKAYSDYCKQHKIPSKSDFVIKRCLEDMYGVTEDRREIVGHWDNVWSGIKLKEVQK